MGQAIPQKVYGGWTWESQVAEREKKDKTGEEEVNRLKE